MEVTFGDFFLSQGTVYRTFTNYHEVDGFYGHPLYSVEGKILRKLQTQKEGFRFVPEKDIQEVFVSRKPQKIEDEGLDFVLEELSAFGVKDIRITGAELLKDYGFKKEKENSKLSDIDLLVCGEKDVAIFKENYMRLYKGKYSSYHADPELIDQLQYRRKHKSHIEMDLQTIKCFESRKPIGNYLGTHINITPSYIIPDYKHKILEDYGFHEVSGTIIGDSQAFCLPGYYEVSCPKYPEVSKLKSNIFFFLIGMNHIGSHFSTRARVLKVQCLEGEEYILEVHSRWSTELSLNVWRA